MAFFARPPRAANGTHMAAVQHDSAGIAVLDSAAAEVAAELGGLDPEQVADLDEQPHDHAVRKALLAQERDTFRTPALETLERPTWSPLRMAGMVALRGYLLVAVALVGVKIAEAIAA